MGTARSMLKRLFRRLWVQGQPGNHSDQIIAGRHYYQLAPTCQIPKLDLLYEMYFGKKSDGCFVEVGAYDGEYCSNTSGLADLGWQGYYIEPVPEYAELCRTRHSKNRPVTVSEYAIGHQNDNVTINVGGPLSTVREQVREHFETLAWAKNLFSKTRVVDVQQLTLEEYLTLHNIERNFELLVIDVEGNEWNVLRNFDIEKWQPQMVIIELHDQNPDYVVFWDECNRIVEYFDDQNYRVIYKDFTNTVYVPKDVYARSLE